MAMAMIFACNTRAADPKVTVEIKDLKKQTALVVKGTCKKAEIGPTLGKMFGQVGAYMRANSIQMASAPMAHYTKVSGDDYELEGGIIVADGTKGKDNVVAIELPAGKTAFAVHVGPYEKFADTYDAMKAFLKSKGMKEAGTSWEIYITDPGNTKPEELKTEVYMPIESK